MEMSIKRSVNFKNIILDAKKLVDFKSLKNKFIIAKMNTEYNKKPTEKMLRNREEISEIMKEINKSNIYEEYEAAYKNGFVGFGEIL